jgi:hypothetical protein
MDNGTQKKWKVKFCAKLSKLCAMKSYGGVDI